MNSGKGTKSVSNIAVWTASLLSVGLLCWEIQLHRHPRRGSSVANDPTLLQKQAQEQEAALREQVKQAPGEAQPRLKLAGFLLDQGRNYDAYDLAQEVAKQFRQNLPAQRALAEVQFRTGRVSDAVSTLRPLAKSRTADRLLLAAYYVRAGERDTAIRELPAANSGLTASEALLAAETRLDALDAAGAVDNLKPVLSALASASPSNGSGTLDLKTTFGLSQILAGRYAEAISPLNAAVSENGSVPVLQFYLGDAIRLSGDLDRLPQAVEHLQKAAQLEPQDGILQYDLALADAQMRDWSNTQQALERAAALRTDVPEVQRDLAHACDKMRLPLQSALARARYLRLLDDSEGAVKVLLPVAQKNPQNVEIGLELSRAQHGARQFTEAGKTLEDLQKRAPGHPEIEWSNYRLRLALQQWKEALDSLDRLEAVSSGDPMILEARADVLERLSRYPEAEPLLTRLRDREPNDPKRQFQLGRFETLWSQRADRFRQAEAALTKAATLQPTQADPFYYLGLLYQNNGKNAEAIAALRHALDLSPENPDALRCLGRAYLQSGDRARSADAFKLLETLEARSKEQTRLELPVTRLIDIHSSRKALAQFFLRRGNLTAAINQLEIVEHFYPTDLSVHAMLEKLYGHERRFQRQYEERLLAHLHAGAARAAN